MTYHVKASYDISWEWARIYIPTHVRARGFEFNSDKKNDLAFFIEHQKKELFFIVKF